MTPAEQYRYLQQDTGSLDELLKPEKLAPIMGAIGGLLMAASGKGLIKTAGIILTVGSLFYGIANPAKVSA